MEIDEFMETLRRRHPNEPEFHQAVREVTASVLPVINRHEPYRKARLLQRLTEPDRIISFRVTWEDDAGEVHVNRGYRVQFSNALGPYKGGLRFDPSVNRSILKFLGFEQIFKNSLTTLPLGGGKGGADFNPKGKSEREIMRFCQAFMTGLHRHVGSEMDVPAGDIGVGTREIGYLFGQYKRLTSTFAGTFTGKGTTYGGSLLRTEATGYGAVYFAQEMLDTRDDALEGKTCLVSGAGNAALYTAEKLIDEGARVLTLSDRGGLLHAPNGLTSEQLNDIITLKVDENGKLADYEGAGTNYQEGEKPWQVQGELAFPAATQNELEASDAEALARHGCEAVCEVANMPVTADATEVLRDAGVLHAPGKAVNAGGVAVSGLEMTQNAMGLSWNRAEVDQRLRGLMNDIHTQCVMHGQRDDGTINYLRGANIAGFRRVADALLAQGVM